ncbi:uncharacterized protein [Magallana gigas]|uniref:uncharacterized protein n=1 Tax=Magallana gigas TaxID=29159 RepID=UPI00333F955A
MNMFFKFRLYMCYKDVLILLSLLTITQAYVNVALNKPAYQQHPHKTGQKKFDASNAVDGRKSDLRPWGGQCVVSGDEKKTATWWVDLTRVHSIHHITIHYMTNNKNWGPFNYYAHFFLGFSVYVSNTPDISQGKLCFKDTNFTLNIIPAVFTTACLLHGQYVIYHNERAPGLVYPNGYSEYARTDLCEVEVFECDVGTF